MGHHHVGDDPVLETAHPVTEHHRGDRTHFSEAFGQQAKGRLAPLVAGEANEAVATPGQHRAEHVQPEADRGPVDHQVLARAGDPRSKDPSLLPPLRLHPGDRPAKIARRALIAGRARRRQQPLGRDATVGGAHPLADEHDDRVGVLRNRSGST